MAVAITFSTTDNGTGITEKDHSSASAGGFAPGAAGQDIYIRHNAVNDITGCKFFIAPYSVSAHANANADYLEMLAWGDGLAAGGPAEASEFGGVQLSMDAGTTWPSYGSEGTVNDVGVVARTGVGDNASNGINLHDSATSGTTGVIPESSTDTRIVLRIQVPTDEATTGQRKFDLRMRFTFTS